MRTPRMPIKKRSSGWSFSVPPSLSPTGKRHRPFFESRAKAEAERQIFINNFKAHGSGGNLLTPSEAEDARNAIDMLKGQGLTLSALVRQYLEQQRIRNKTLPFSEILDQVYAIKSGAQRSPIPGASKNSKPLREKTLKDMRYYYQKGKDALGKIDVVDLDTETVTRKIGKACPSDAGYDLAIRYLKAAFNIAVKAGWAPHNPFLGIEKTHNKDGQPEILSLKECKSVFAACRDLRHEASLSEIWQVDARPATPFFAIALFAGIRPEEVERLDWADIHFDHSSITVKASVSKTGTLRHVHMSENLKSWLDPYRKEEGLIIPPNWKRIYQAVRKIAGLAKHPDGTKRQTDLLRHTYATAFLCSGQSWDDLLPNIGHATKETTRNHYLNSMPKHEALEFWRIGPEGWSEFERAAVNG